jgi:hypothetical protein
VTLDAQADNCDDAGRWQRDDPGVGSSGPDRQALIMIAARRLGQAVILAFALLYRDVRVVQVVFAMAFLREAFDLRARMQSGAGIQPATVVVMLVIEVAAFIHLGAIASGRSPKYLPGRSSAHPVSA